MRLRSLLLVGVLAASTVGATVPRSSTDVADATLHRAIVRFAGAEVPSALPRLLDLAGAEEVVVFETINAAAVTAPVAGLRALARDPAVAAIRSERRLQLDLYQSVGQMDAQGVEEPDSYTTADGRQTTRPGVTGDGQYVAVIDSGIFDAHPDLLGQVVAHRNFEFAYGVQLLDASALDAYAEATGPSAATDDIGHGTHVAGTVAGLGTASQGRENHGVAPGAKLVDLRIAAGPIQALVDDAGWERNAIAAFDWLLRHHDDPEFGAHGIRVNTNSWGLTGTDLIFGAPDYDPLRDIIEQVVDAGIVTVFSAGNDGAEDNVTDATVPNGLPDVISVAAACKTDAYTSSCDPAVDGDMASFTSHGPAVDIAAPGVGILSTVHPSLIGALSKIGDPDPVFGIGYGDHFGESPEQQAVHRAAYGTASGTSMAAPHIAGAVALLLEANPDLTPAQVQDVLETTAKDLLDPGHDVVSGWGLADVDDALRVAHELTLDGGGEDPDEPTKPGRGHACDRGDDGDGDPGCGGGRDDRPGRGGPASRGDAAPTWSALRVR